MMFDLHTVVTLKNGFTALLASSSAWRAAMGTGRVASGTADSWRTQLSAAGIRIRSGYTPEDAKEPQITVALREAQPQQDIDAFNFGSPDGEDTLRMAVRGTVIIRCHSESAELARAMHAAVLSIMLGYKDQFLKAGYQDLVWLGGGDLSPEESLFGSRLNVFSREQRWASLYDQTATITDPTSDLPIVVGAIDAEFTVDGVGSVAGGITGET